MGFNSAFKGLNQTIYMPTARFLAITYRRLGTTSRVPYREDGTDTLCRNVGKELPPLYAA